MTNKNSEIKTITQTFKFKITGSRDYDFPTLDYIFKNMRNHLAKCASTYSATSYNMSLFRNGLADDITSKINEIAKTAYKESEENILGNKNAEVYYKKWLTEIEKDTDNAIRSKELMQIFSKGSNGKEGDRGVDSYKGWMQRWLKKLSENSSMHSSVVDSLITDVADVVVSNAIKEGMYHNTVKIPNFTNKMAIPARGGINYAVALPVKNNPKLHQLSLKILNKSFAKELEDGVEIKYKKNDKERVITYKKKHTPDDEKSICAR